MSVISREPIKVLDHGFVRYVEHLGKGDAGVDEAGIIEAARQSTQGNFRGWEQDEKLLKFLFSGKPQHATPFEFCELVVEVRAPIFVFREWHRHRTQSYNEMSARYAPLPDMNYVPSVERLLINSKTNRQAGTVKGSEELDDAGADWFRTEIREHYKDAEIRYQAALKQGVPKELARLVLPVGRYSQMRAKANLRNWLAFVTLRSDPAAQWEIRQYSEAVERIVGECFPRTYDLFVKRRSAT